jgi:hypothetical protein
MDRMVRDYERAYAAALSGSAAAARLTALVPSADERTDLPAG